MLVSKRTITRNKPLLISTKNTILAIYMRRFKWYDCVMIYLSKGYINDIFAFNALISPYVRFLLVEVALRLLQQVNLML